MNQQTEGKIKISFAEALRMLFPYFKSRIVEQIQSVWLIITYLVVFQVFILGIPVTDASVIALGIGLVVIGLAFFMEGLTLGLMPLGEIVGVKLPQKSGTFTILAFACVLGYLATLAEPAIAVLQQAGSSVNPWEAPLLYIILNHYSEILVTCVGIGVGLAVCLSMLRFLKNWSLKPFIFISIPILLVITAYGAFDPNMQHLIGLAWDCGAVTTGPVTVPLVLALGIGISRLVGDGEGGIAGFGAVTVASIFPIFMVLCLGIVLKMNLPEPMSLEEFKKSDQTILIFAGDQEAKDTYFKRWTDPQGAQSADGSSKPIDDILWENIVAAVRAIAMLSLPMIIFLIIVLRERVPKADELFLGLSFAIIGMAIFSIGVVFGIDKLGRQVGQKLPSSFSAIPLADETKSIKNFDKSKVYTALTTEGEKEEFFYAKTGKDYKTIPYKEENLNEKSKLYQYTPILGPLFGPERGVLGIAIVLIFAFIMGYGATLAEPALNAMGATVEELTVGTFRKNVLMQAVSIGVGVGITMGIAKIVFNLPLAWMLIPPYIVLLILSFLSTEEFVNIAWDSAGVTTGPITVPLVLAMGLGVGSQVQGVVEGFGILSMASVYPIMSVLSVGMIVTHRRNAAVAKSTQAESNEMINESEASVV